MLGIQGPWHHYQQSTSVEPSRTFKHVWHAHEMSNCLALLSRRHVPCNVLHVLHGATAPPSPHTTQTCHHHNSGWMKASRLKEWTGSSSNPKVICREIPSAGLSMGYLSQCPWGLIFITLYSTHNNPQIGCIWTSLLPLITWALKHLDTYAVTCFCLNYANLTGVSQYMTTITVS
jgi:hypothetical protein